jgi:transposase-like protein
VEPFAPTGAGVCGNTITGFKGLPDKVLCLRAFSCSTIVPSPLGRYLRVGDRITTIGFTAFLIDRCRDSRWSSMIYTSISNVSEPRLSKGGEWFVRAESAENDMAIKAVFVSGNALPQYFYLLGSDADALEALKGLKTASEIGQTFSVHPNLVAIWKKQATDGIQSLFENPREDSAKQQELEAERDELFRQIGQLKVELDWLKKIWPGSSVAFCLCRQLRRST